MELDFLVMDKEKLCRLYLSTRAARSRLMGVNVVCSLGPWLLVRYFVFCFVLSAVKVKRKQISFEVTFKSHFWPLHPFSAILNRFYSKSQDFPRKFEFVSISNYNIKYLWKICQSWLDRQNHSKSRYWTSFIANIWPRIAFFVLSKRVEKYFLY